MTITFVSNYLTLHQIPLCEAIYRKLGDDFCFINTQPMESERRSMGWENKRKFPFELDLQQMENRIDDSEIVIIGSAEEMLIQNRIRTNKAIIRYSERILKNGRWHIFSPRAIRNMLKTHTSLRNKRVWMLCASAYAAGDYALFGAYQGKCYQWGYFPKMIRYSETQVAENKKHTVIRLMWCGRMIRLKHPEMAVLVAEYLKARGISFHMDIIGDGEMRQEIQHMVVEKRLEDAISLHGFLAPEQVRGYMEKANLYLFTSDFHEGWGAVLNEAMNSGCACVVSHAIGAAPYLIQDGVNGFLYRNGNAQQFCEKVERLVRDPELCSYLGMNAYYTIANVWNADIAAQRLLDFCDAILHEKSIPVYAEGPMSRAGFLSNYWYRK